MRLSHYLALLLLGIMACTQAGPERTYVYTGQPVWNGTTDTSHSAVVFISTPVGTCTATFITARHLITAAHCLDMTFFLQPSPYAGEVQPTMGTAWDGVDAWTGNQYEFDTVTFFPSIPYVASGWVFYSSPVDVALLTLAPGYHFQGQPQRLMGPDQIPTYGTYSAFPGEVVELVGYSDNAPQSSTNRRRRGNAIVTAKVVPGHMEFDVDGSVYQNKLCSGDSGGPMLLDNVYGQAEIGAINSGVYERCYYSPPGNYWWLSVGAFIPWDYVDDILCGAGWEFLGAHRGLELAASPTELIRLSEDGRVCRFRPAGPPKDWYVALLRDNGEILEYNRWSQSWRRIAASTAAPAEQLVALQDGLYRRNADGQVWKWLRPNAAWSVVDPQVDPNKRLAGWTKGLYQLRGNGDLYMCRNTPPGAAVFESCVGGWKHLGLDSYATRIVAGGWGLVQEQRQPLATTPVQTNVTLWQYDVPTDMWLAFYNALDVTIPELAVGDTAAYLRWPAQIDRYQSGWATIDWDPSVVSLVTLDDQLYQMTSDGRVWRYVNVGGWWEVIGSNDFAATAIFGSDAQ